VAITARRPCRIRTRGPGENLTAPLSLREAHCVLRPAVTGDIESIERLLDLAFAPSAFESRLVKALVMGRRAIHHSLLERDRQILAYTGQDSFVIGYGAEFGSGEQAAEPWRPEATTDGLRSTRITEILRARSR
jgi:hypothetical protein